MEVSSFSSALKKNRTSLLYLVSLRKRKTAPRIMPVASRMARCILAEERAQPIRVALITTRKIKKISVI
jgi:hypothetical protein